MSPVILPWSEIQTRLAGLDVVAAMERAFDAYAQGLAVIPPVGEMTFADPPGDVHIKYGYLQGGSHYVVKIASGFYDNPARGLSSCQGMMLLFTQDTGQPAAILLDEGRLTDIRTGAAGAVAARHLAPSHVTQIGIVGTGIQAREQLRYLAQVTTCRQALAWGRDKDRLDAFLVDAASMGFDVRGAADPAQLAGQCNLIVTTTPSPQPLLKRAWIRPGTHITAVGADTPHKQELDPAILRDARVVTDSIAQSQSRGEVYQCRAAGMLREIALVALGDVIGGRAPGRQGDEEITVADLTGVAVQDLAIAQAVMGD